MHHFQRQLVSIIREIRQAQDSPQRPKDGLTELYMLLGHEQTSDVLQLVDLGVVCLLSNGRTLFRINQADPCFCLLPGPFCSACCSSPPESMPSGIGTGIPCTHIIAILVAVAQSRYSVEPLAPKDLAATIFRSLHD